MRVDVFACRAFCSVHGEMLCHGCDGAGPPTVPLGSAERAGGRGREAVKAELLFPFPPLSSK